MIELKVYQKQYLKGLAHSLKPIVLVGKGGVTPALIKEVNTALSFNELIKIKFVDAKEKDQKLSYTVSIEKETGASMVGMTGHIAILYKQHPHVDKRKIVIPQK